MQALKLNCYQGDACAVRERSIAQAPTRLTHRRTKWVYRRENKTDFSRLCGLLVCILRHGEYRTM